MPPLLTALLWFSWFSATSANAQTAPPLPNDLPEPTSAASVLQANPIRLRISQEAPSGDLPSVTGAFPVTAAVETALKNNLSFRQTSFDTRMARLKALRELGRFGPVVSFNPFFSTSSLNQMLFNPASESFGMSWPMQPINKGTLFSAIIAGSQPIYTGGFLRGNYRAARAVANQSVAALQSERINTSLRTKQAYWATIFQQAKLRVDTDYVHFREQSTRNMKAKWEVGKVPRADYLREEAELARARNQVNQDYREFNIALINLKVEMGVNFTSLIDLTDELKVELPADDNMEKFLQKAAVNRPEITQAASKVDELRGRQQVARSAYMPHVNAYGLVSNVTGDSPDGKAHGKTGGFIGVIGHITLFDSAQGFNDIRAANVAVRQALLAKQQAQQKVAQEVVTAWIDRDTALRNVDLAKAEIVSAEEDYRLLHARYLVGKATPLEQFDAAVRLFKARLVLVEATYNFQLAQERLTAAAGAI